MNILVSVNAKYLKPLKVLISSLVRTQKEKCHIYFLNMSLTSLEEGELLLFCSFLETPVTIITMPPDIKDLLRLKEQELKISGSPLSCETYSRLFTPSLLPNIDRILWLDADCIIKGDLSDFYYQDLKGSAIGACDHCNWILPGVPAFSFWEYPKRKRIPEYFNAGVILFNVTRCKMMPEFEKSSMEERIKNSNMDNAPHQDQSILNKIFYPTNVKWNSPLLYNLFVNEDWDSGFSSYSGKYKIYEKAKILHYCSPHKPWDLLNSFDPILRGYWVEEYMRVLKIEREIFY